MIKTAILFFWLLWGHFLYGMEEVESFGNNPGNLRMHIHVPDNLDGIIPLVVALHGCSQNANELAEQSGWNKLADRYHFIVLYPEQKRSNNVSNCFNWFNSKDHGGDRGEYASIRSMIDELVLRYEIDVNRIFTYGLSAGAAMANSLMANEPSYFNAGAIFAGGPHGSAVNAFQGMKVMMNPEDRSPEEWGGFVKREEEGRVPRVIIVHGTKDNVVHIQNANELIDQWSYLHEIDNRSDEILQAFLGNPAVHRYAHLKDGREVVVFYKLQGVGHRLAVNPGNGDMEGGETGLFAVDIDFFSTYFVARDFGLIE